MYELAKVVTSLDIRIFKYISRFQNVRLETMVSKLSKCIQMMAIYIYARIKKYVHDGELLTSTKMQGIKNHRALNI
jgi:glutathionyl-hydroquinone reductase